MSAVAAKDVHTLLHKLVVLGGWRSSPSSIHEAMPHMAAELNVNDVTRTLDSLRVPYSTLACRERDVTRQECPALLINQTGTASILLDRQGDQLVVLGADTQEAEQRLATGRKCTLIRIERFQNRTGERQTKSVREIFSILRPIVPWLIVTTLLTNVLGLMTPLLTMLIYDRVIPSGSVEFLISLALGVLIVLAADFAFRSARTRALAYVGQEGERELCLALFQKLMALPLAQLQRSDVDQQMTRFRQFEALRDVFTGQVMTTLLDLPFVVLFLALLFVIAPPIGWFTLGVLTLFVVLGLLTHARQARLQDAAGDATKALRSVVNDAVDHQRDIINLGLQHVWYDRVGPLAEASETAMQRAQLHQATTQSLGQGLAGLGAVGTIVLGTYSAVDGAMTFGALIASIALVSKVIAPVHALLGNLGQIATFLRSRQQADRVLSLSEEMELGLDVSHQKKLTGQIAFSAVTHRPDPLNAPVLAQATLEVQPGELVVIMGTAIAGRTAVLDLIDGLYTPLAGTIEHDEVDIRQIPRDELRRSITYFNYDASLFYGTVAQNFRLATPSVSDDAIRSALQHMGLEAFIDSLPQGIDTVLTDKMLSDLPQDTLRSLALARCVARDTSIYLFAEPTTALSTPKRANLTAWIQAQRGAKTMLLATADRSFLDLADRFMFIDNGRVVLNDVGVTGRKKINAALTTFGG